MSSKITFIVNVSVNTLDHTKLLLKSLRENLNSKEHEILIFVDSDNEGTADYLKEQKKNFYDLKIITHKLNPCVGYSRNSNLLVELAKHDIVSYLQSDMVISKDYDVHILEALEENCILSATRIEPPLHGLSSQTITQDFGVEPEEFKWDEFLDFSAKMRRSDTLEYFFAPFTFYKSVWLELGGYDTQFRRSREDSDLLQRFVQKGVKIKQTFNANVYHFSCVSSRGKNWFDQSNNEIQLKVQLQNVADQIELRRFVRKWGNFNHGEGKLVKLDTDLVLICDTPNRIPLLAQLEPYFTRVWLKDKTELDQVLKLYETEHTIANQLLKFSDDDWENARQFYNQTDYSMIYRIGEPDQHSIKVTLDIVKDVEQYGKTFLDAIPNLATLLQDAEPDTYEVGGAIIDVRRIINTVNDNLKVINPPFDYSLLTID